MITSIRSCPFSQGAIYWPQGMWSNMWGLDEPDGDSQGFHSVNPTYLTTAWRGGIFFEISPFKNSHDLLSNVNDYPLWFMRTLLNDAEWFAFGLACSSREITPSYRAVECGNGLSTRTWSDEVAKRGFEDMNYQGEDGEIEFRSAGVDYQKQKQSNLY